MIEFKDVRKIYNRNIIALDNINLNIEKNKTSCILGRNGAGKTTLLKCLVGLTIPDSGDITIFNNKIDYKKRDYLKDICIVLEGSRNLYWRAKVISNFYYFGALKGIKKKQIDENLKKYIHLFEIEDLLNRQVRTLSLGQKQKVSILCSILLEPKILILDEPSNGLDIETKAILVDTLATIKEKCNTTLLITSHDIYFAIRFCEEFIVINDGKFKGKILNDNLQLKELEERYIALVSRGGE